MLDIDHFKQINDKYGHATGDVAIQAIAQSCNSSLRSHDIVARIGGEGFCMVLPYTNKKVACIVAEKLRKIISNISMSTINEDISMTVSIGVSQVETSDVDHTAILKRADEKMYKAKETGRNRVCT
jgi:diguanylate cyclase (GGDEF)-like protein